MQSYRRWSVKPVPYLHVMPRVDRDIKQCLAWRPETGIELRRCISAQFAIVYAYLRPTERFDMGVVSIRAVRHSRVKDVFAGVNEPTAAYAAMKLSAEPERKAR
jgi:predicted phage gp36 major capsid-like protein